MALNGGGKHCLAVDGLVVWLAAALAFRKTLFRENFAQIDENQTHNLGRSLIAGPPHNNNVMAHLVGICFWTPSLPEFDKNGTFL